MTLIHVALASPDDPSAHFFCPRCGRHLGAFLDHQNANCESAFPIQVGPFPCPCGHTIRLSILGWELNPTDETPARLSPFADAIPILERNLARNSDVPDH